jgi:hypothetical protein
MSERWTPAYARMFEPEHELAGDPVCQRWAFLDLCHMAQFRDGTRVLGGTVITLPRGCLLASIRFLSQRWNWSKSRVDRFLRALQDPAVEKIEPVSETRFGTVYRIVRYDTYANPWDTNGDTGGTGTGTPAGHRRDTNGDKEQQVLPSTSSIGRATQLPKSWAPTAEHIQRASSTGLDLVAEVEKFRAHATEKGRSAKNWNGAFTRWLINAKEFRAQSNGRRSGGRSYSDPTLEIDWEAEARRINQGES